MKKIFCLIFAFGLLFALFGCSGEAETVPVEKVRVVFYDIPFMFYEFRQTEGVGETAVVNTSGITKFHFQWYESLSEVRNHSIDVDRDGLVYKRGGEAKSFSISQELWENLTGLYEKHGVARWDGYEKCNEDWCDGGGFNLILEFADGQILTCSGLNSEPEGWKDFQNELFDLLHPIIFQ